MPTLQAINGTNRLAELEVDDERRVYPASNCDVIRSVNGVRDDRKGQNKAASGADMSRAIIATRQCQRLTVIIQAATDGQTRPGTE